jgi:phage terminase large subunit-like protein
VGKVKRKTRGDRNIEWIELYCRIPEGRFVGRPVKLTPKQRKWIKRIYDTPTRTFILSMGRKNGKTAFIAFLLLLHTCGPEARPNSQLYSGAQSKEQAAIVFGLASKIVRMSPDLNVVMIIRDTVKQLLCPALGTVYRSLSAEASTAYGLSPVFNVHDELGQVRGPRSELYEAMETGMSAHDEPLSLIISTQAPNSSDLLSILIDDAKTGKDRRVKLEIYSAPEDCDPFTEKAIRAANPHFDDFMNKEEVFDQMRKAQRMPSSEAGFRNLNLNQRVDQTSPFIARTVWERAQAEIDPGVFQDVFLALDLSARNDLTALVGIGLVKGQWLSWADFFAPAVGIHERAQRDRAPYDLWAAQGYITATPGASVDYSFVAMKLIEYSKKYRIRKIAYDRWRIDVLKKELTDLGANDLAELMEPFGQGFKDMAPALDIVEADLLSDVLKHPGNPVLTWCAANSISVKDPAGNRKLDKSKTSGRIDGMVALVMARGVAAKYQNEDVDISAFLNNPLRV